jgi:hypothetical protein
MPNEAPTAPVGDAADPCESHEGGGQDQCKDEEAAAASVPPDDGVYALVCNMCRGDKSVLCVAEDLMQDDINRSPGMCMSPSFSAD